MPAVNVSRETHRNIKVASAKLGVKAGEYAERELGPRAALDAEREQSEPLSQEAVAALVSLIAAATGESFEVCFLRIVSRAVMVEFAERCCPE